MSGIGDSYGAYEARSIKTPTPHCGFTPRTSPLASSRLSATPPFGAAWLSSRPFVKIKETPALHGREFLPGLNAVTLGDTSAAPYRRRDLTDLATVLSNL